MDIPEQLKQAADTAHRDRAVVLTPRELIGWYGYFKRGAGIGSKVRGHMKQLKVATVPDFDSAWLDHSISLVPEQKLQEVTPKKPEGEETGGEPERVETAHLISRLKAANTTPIYVTPDDTIDKAVTLMMSHDFSQLPIMISPGSVRGMISWKSLGKRLALGKTCHHVRECSEHHQELMSTASIFDAVEKVGTHDCVLIRSETRMVIGIVTAFDISKQFGDLAEPFLLLGNIEGSLRTIIDQTFTVEELKTMKDPKDEDRDISSAANLTFGEYKRLLEKPANWDKLKLKLDRKVVVENLERVRVIRNDVMHFDPEGIDDKQMATLRRFNNLLEQIGEINRG